MCSYKHFNGVLFVLCLFVTLLQIYEYFHFRCAQGYAKLEELATYLKSSGSLADEVSGKLELTNDDVQNILDTLVYDGKVEEYHDPRDQVM